MSASERRALYYQRNRETILSRVSAWQKRNRERKNANARASYAKRRAAMPPNPPREKKWTPEYKRSYQRAWRAKNAERIREQLRAWYEAHRVQQKAKSAAWVKANRERARANRRRRYGETGNNDRRRLQAREWKRRNPQNGLDLANRRRARLAGAITEPYSRPEIFARDGGRCHICHRSVSRAHFHVDHLVPIRHGGADAPWNVAIAHPKCNLARGAGRLPAQLRLA